MVLEKYYRLKSHIEPRAILPRDMAQTRTRAHTQYTRRLLHTFHVLMIKNKTGPLTSMRSSGKYPHTLSVDRTRSRYLKKWKVHVCTRASAHTRPATYLLQFSACVGIWKIAALNIDNFQKFYQVVS